MTKAKPRAIPIIPSVATKGGVFPLAMIRPLKSPHKAPTPKPIRIPTTPGTPSLRKLAAMTLVSARTEPTDRSIPAIMMTKVIPTATMPITETCRRTFIWFCNVRKAGVSKEITTTRRIRANKVSSRPTYLSRSLVLCLMRVILAIMAVLLSLRAFILLALNILFIFLTKNKK
jgi:hypothetical protein